MADGSTGYGLWGVTFIGRMTAWGDDRGEFNLVWGLGVGHAADILSDFGINEGALQPYGHVGVETRWHLGGDVLLGVEALFEHFSVITLALNLGYRF